jgi:hypothetical protein
MLLLKGLAETISVEGWSHKPNENGMKGAFSVDNCPFCSLQRSGMNSSGFGQ